MIEAEVHSFLKAFVKTQNQSPWLHHLTMARLVARALRLGKSALIQTSTGVEEYSLSYLTPALLWHELIILVAPAKVQSKLLAKTIPQLQQFLKTNKEVKISDCYVANFSGLILIEPENWLKDRLGDRTFPDGIPTIIDGAEHLEQWTQKALGCQINLQDWQYPGKTQPIEDVTQQIHQAILTRPPNPYEYYLLEPAEIAKLEQLFNLLALEPHITRNISNFLQKWSMKDHLLWVSLGKERKEFTLHLAPVTVTEILRPLWHRQPVVFVGSFLDLETQASIYRQHIGLTEILALKFSPHRQSNPLDLYLPKAIPLPNTPQFQQVLTEQVLLLLGFSGAIPKPIVILVEDIPLKAQIGTVIAAQFGSRVRVEKTNLTDNNILVSGWEFWLTHQDNFPTPQLLIVTTLPIPSLENPLVAAKVAHYKRLHQDWFRFYLFPTALRKLQQAILPLRQSPGIVAILDNRVNHRSYGSKILEALEPCARFNYIEPSWFG